MKNCLNACSALLAAICALLFVSLAAVILIVFIADRLLFNAGTYKQALRSQRVYDRMPELIAEQLIYQEEHTSTSNSISYELSRLTQSDWEIMLSDLLTPAALQTQAESVIDQFFTYLNTPSKPLKLKVSLVDFRQKLDGEAGYRAVMHIIDAQPACDSAEWNAFLSSGSYQFVDIPLCRPSEDVLAASEPYIREALHDVVSTIPSETYLDNRSGAASSTSTDDGRVVLQRVHRYIALSLCIPLGLFMLVAVFGVRSFTGCGLWLGIPLLFTGLISLVAAIITWALPGWLIARNATGGKVIMEGVAPGVTQALVDVGTSLANSAARTIGIVSVVLILLGVGLLAAGFLAGMVRRSDLF